MINQDYRQIDQDYRKTYGYYVPLGERAHHIAPPGVGGQAPHSGPPGLGGPAHHRVNPEIAETVL